MSGWEARYLRDQLDAAGLQAELIQGDLFTYASEHRFDAIYEQTCLCAIQPEQRADYERCLFSWLKPAAILYAMFMQTGAAGVTSSVRSVIVAFLLCLLDLLQLLFRYPQGLWISRWME